MKIRKFDPKNPLSGLIGLWETVIDIPGKLRGSFSPEWVLAYFGTIDEDNDKYEVVGTKLGEMDIHNCQCWVDNDYRRYFEDFDDEFDEQKYSDDDGVSLIPSESSNRLRCVLSWGPKDGVSVFCYSSHDFFRIQPVYSHAKFDQRATTLTLSMEHLFPRDEMSKIAMWYLVGAGDKHEIEAFCRGGIEVIQ